MLSPHAGRGEAANHARRVLFQIKHAARNVLIYRHKFKPFDFAAAMTITAPRLALSLRDVNR